MDDLNRRKLGWMCSYSSDPLQVCQLGRVMIPKMMYGSKAAAAIGAMKYWRSSVSQQRT
jgi:hypothetical protein